jgi:hypothetical protein
MTSAVRQVAFYDPTPTSGGASAWTAYFSADTLAGSTIVVFATKSNFASNNFGTGDCSDGVNGVYTSLNLVYDTGNQGWASYYFPNAAVIPAATGVLISTPYEDYIGTVAVEVTGVLAASLAGHTGAVATPGGSGTDNISSGTAALGSAPVIIVAIANSDSNGLLASVGTGFTSALATWQWDGAGPSARVESRNVANPGTAGATFDAVGADTLGCLMVALLDLTATGVPLMANFADRVQETTTTSGTGTLTLGGAVASYQSFASAFPTLTQVAYRLLDGNNWEVGYGTFTTGFLSRDTVVQSSNSNALITLSGGSTSVVCTGLAQAFDWPTYATKVPSADILVIPANRQLCMASDLNLAGSVIALGDIAIL